MRRMQISEQQERETREKKEITKFEIEGRCDCVFILLDRIII